MKHMSSLKTYPTSYQTNFAAYFVYICYIPINIQIQNNFFYLKIVHPSGIY